MLESSELRHAAELRIGKRFGGKWRLDELIGMGGTAAVYAATHRNGSRVAIKILHRHLCSSQSQVRRFLNEAYTANRIGHAGAVAIFDDGSEGEDAFLVMELLTGKNLRDHAEARGGFLSLRETLRIADELLDVLAAAHARGIVHRDIKPSNLFLSSSGQLKVLDFGMARALVPLPEGQTTCDGEVIGTPAFMSPEQARGRPELVDARTDVWSVGATLFWLLSGELVHGGGTATEQLYLTMSASAPSLASLLPELPASVVKAIDRCLDYDREQRWQSAQALREALRSWKVVESPARSRSVTDSEVAPLSISTLTSERRAAPRTEKKLLAVLATVAIVGVAYVGGAQLHGGEPRTLLKAARSARHGLDGLRHAASTVRQRAGVRGPERVLAGNQPAPSSPAVTAAPKVGDRIAAHAAKRQFAVSSSKQSEIVQPPSNDELLSTDPLNRRH